MLGVTRIVLIIFEFFSERALGSAYSLCTIFANHEAISALWHLNQIPIVFLFGVFRNIITDYTIFDNKKIVGNDR